MKLISPMSQTFQPGTWSNCITHERRVSSAVGLRPPSGISASIGGSVTFGRGRSAGWSVSFLRIGPGAACPSLLVVFPVLRVPRHSVFVQTHQLDLFRTDELTRRRNILRINGESSEGVFRFSRRFGTLLTPSELSFGTSLRNLCSSGLSLTVDIPSTSRCSEFSWLDPMPSLSVNGRQYVAVMTGDGQSATANPLQLTRTRTVRGHNEIYVFALPAKR